MLSLSVLRACAKNKTPLQYCNCEGMDDYIMLLFFGISVKFIIHLPGIFLAETKIPTNVLQGSTALYHCVKPLERILAILIFEMTHEFVSRLDVEPIAPMGNCARSDIEQAGNLRIGQRLAFHFFPDKLFNAISINFQGTLLSQR